MSNYVILLTDAHEAPAYELIEALRAARAFWPGAPLLACRRHANGYQTLNLRSLDGTTLKRLGFKAIADKAAQIPALLREIEGHGGTGELRLPEIVQKPSEPGTMSLPNKLKANGLRAAFDLVSSLHFIGDQNGAAENALVGLQQLINADRWAIYLFSEAKGLEGSILEAIAVRRPNDPRGVRSEEHWRRMLTGDPDLPLGSETKAAKRAAAGMGIIKRKEAGQFVLAVPLICGERILRGT